MREYFVSIDNEERNEAADNLSITGRVNDINCAVVIRLSSLRGVPEARAKNLKQRALAQAFIHRQSSPPTETGDKVTI